MRVREGLAGERRVFACSWLSNAVMGSIQAHSGAGRTATLAAMVGRAGLSKTDDALLAEIARNHDPLQRQAIFAFEPENIISGLSRLIHARDQHSEQVIASNRDDARHGGSKICV